MSRPFGWVGCGGLVRRVVAGRRDMGAWAAGHSVGLTGLICDCDCGPSEVLASSQLVESFDYGITLTCFEQQAQRRPPSPPA